MVVDGVTLLTPVNTTMTHHVQLPTGTCLIVLVQMLVQSLPLVLIVPSNQIVLGPHLELALFWTTVTLHSWLRLVNVLDIVTSLQLVRNAQTATAGDMDVDGAFQLVNVWMEQPVVLLMARALLQTLACLLLHAYSFLRFHYQGLLFPRSMLHMVVFNRQPLSPNWQSATLLTFQILFPNIQPLTASNKVKMSTLFWQMWLQMKMGDSEFISI